MGLLDQGILYRDEQGNTILPTGNTLSSEREKWQYRGYIYNMTGNLWDVGTDKEGNIIGQGFLPEYQQYFYEGMDLWNLENMQQTSERIDEMNEKMFEEQRLLELEKNRENMDLARERWKTGDITFGEVFGRFGEIKPGQAYYFDPETSRWQVGRVDDLNDSIEKAYTYTGADWQEGVEYVKESYRQYQELQAEVSNLIDNQIAQERADYLLRGMEYNISDEEIARMKEEKFNEITSEDDRKRMEELLLEFGTPDIGPINLSESTQGLEAYSQMYLAPKSQGRQNMGVGGPSSGSLLIEENQI